MRIAGTPFAGYAPDAVSFSHGVKAANSGVYLSDLSRERDRAFRESLIKSRLTAWHAICLHIFRHLARKLLAGRQPSGVVFIQSDEKI